MVEGFKLTGAACRAGRGLLSWSQTDLRRAAQVGPRVVVAVEKDEAVSERVARKLIDTFAANGVELLNGDSPGARLAKRPAQS